MSYTAYWDMPDNERALLDDEAFSRLIAVELMETGATPPAPAHLIPVPQLPVLATETWYQVGDSIFATMSQAEAYLALTPHKADCDWSVGYDRKYPKKVEAKVESVELHSKSELAQYGPVLKEHKAATEHNEKEQARFDKEHGAYMGAAADMRADWYAQRAEKIRLDNIMRVYIGYVETAGGDHAVASKFIVKAYPSADVRKAFEWSGTNWVNDPELPQPADEVRA